MSDPAHVIARTLITTPRDVRRLEQLAKHHDDPQVRKVAATLLNVEGLPTVSECPLTRKELQAVRGLARGLTYKEIAAEQGKETGTIRTHLQSSYKKLCVIDRAQAVMKCYEEGWL